MSYIIVFWDKSKIQVRDEAAEKLKAVRAAGRTATFDVGKDQYSTSGIEKIITKDTAYDAYPQEWEVLREMQDSQIESGQTTSDKQLTGGLKELT